MNSNMMIYFFLFILYIASLFIIAGIDKENIQIQKSVLLFGMILSFIYMTYVCIQNSAFVHTYIIYLVSMIILLTLDVIYLKIYLHQSYIIGILMLSLYMVMFSGTFIFFITVFVALIWLIIELLWKKIRRKENKKIPVGFNLCVSNILVIIVLNLLSSWVI